MRFRRVSVSRSFFGLCKSIIQGDIGHRFRRDLPVHVSVISIRRVLDTERFTSRSRRETSRNLRWKKSNLKESLDCYTLP